MKRVVMGAALGLLVFVVVLVSPMVAGATPNNLNPANGASLAANAQVFTWGDNATQGPVDHWWMEISTSPQVDYYPWGYFSGGLVFTLRATTASANLNALGRALAPGTYYWHVGGYYGPFGSLGTAWSNVQSFTIRSATATAPKIAVNPTSFSLDVEYNDPTWQSANLAISNSGGGTLYFAIPTFDVMWLGAASGTSTGIVYTLPIAVRPFSDASATAPLPPGTYTTNITVQDNGSSPPATNSPRLVPVTMKVWATDNTAPTGTSVKIAGGKSATRKAAVTLSMTATDSGSKMGEMRFANVAGQWSSWVPYASTRAWTLAAGDGTKTVYAQFRDNVGNESGVVFDTIIVDKTKPTTKAPYSARVRRGRTATLRYRVMDAAPNGGTAKATIRIKTLRGKTVKTIRASYKPVNTTQKVSFRCRLAKGAYKFYVYAVDRAGNSQSRVGWNRLRVR